MLGEKFGKLTVIEQSQNGIRGRFMWKCLCDCGRTTVRDGYTLIRNGNKQNCGCYKIKHGGSYDLLYNLWGNILYRCNTASFYAYENYGGRGIKVCEEWLDYNNFKEWALKNNYKCGLTIDRIDVNGNYEPDNCRWANRFVQANNRRNTRYLTVNNITKTYGEWAKISNINIGVISFRVKAKWKESDFFIPVRKMGKYEREKKFNSD